MYLDLKTRHTWCRTVYCRKTSPQKRGTVETLTSVSFVYPSSTRIRPRKSLTVNKCPPLKGAVYNSTRPILIFEQT